jgi:hypothetical protein
MSTTEATRALNQIERAAGVAFERGGRIAVGQWSYADCRHAFTADRCVFIEVERAQKHPTTNVVKYWPWLEDDVSRTMILIHLFDRNTSRRSLARWLGVKMETELAGRFRYLSADLPLSEDDLNACVSAVDWLRTGYG